MLLVVIINQRKILSNFRPCHMLAHPILLFILKVGSVLTPVSVVAVSLNHCKEWLHGKLLLVQLLPNQESPPHHASGTPELKINRSTSVFLCWSERTAIHIELYHYSCNAFHSIPKHCTFLGSYV